MTGGKLKYNLMTLKRMVASLQPNLTSTISYGASSTDYVFEESLSSSNTQLFTFYVKQVRNSHGLREECFILDFFFFYLKETGIRGILASMFKCGVSGCNKYSEDGVRKEE